MATVRPYYEFLMEVAELPWELFSRRVPGPQLYFPSLPDLLPSELLETAKLEQSISPRAPIDLGLQAIIPLVKDLRSNAFKMMITVGRSRNNDLVIPDDRISKFHAYFTQTEREWSLTDARSTNGTRINGVALRGDQTLHVYSGAVLLFAGQIQAVFLEPAELYQQVQESKLWFRA